MCFKWWHLYKVINGFCDAFELASEIGSWVYKSIEAIAEAEASGPSFLLPPPPPPSTSRMFNDVFRL